MEFCTSIGWSASFIVCYWATLLSVSLDPFYIMNLDYWNYYNYIEINVHQLVKQAEFAML